MLIPKEGPKQVSDGSGERGEEEKVFTRWPKVGRAMGKLTGQVPVGRECRRWSMSPVVDSDMQGLRKPVIWTGPNQSSAGNIARKPRKVKIPA